MIESLVITEAPIKEFETIEGINFSKVELIKTEYGTISIESLKNKILNLVCLIPGLSFNTALSVCASPNSVFSKIGEEELFEQSILLSWFVDMFLKAKLSSEKYNKVRVDYHNNKVPEDDNEFVALADSVSRIGNILTYKDKDENFTDEYVVSVLTYDYLSFVGRLKSYRTRISKNEYRDDHLMKKFESEIAKIREEN